MHTFAHGDKTVAFTVLSGEVVGSEKLSETRVTSTGGVQVNGKDGEVTPVRVSSVSIINHEFWIRTPDGVEHDVKLRGVDIPLRTGQNITLISALKKDGTPLHAVLQNHTAAKRWVLRDANALNTELELTPFNWNTFLIVSGLCIAGFVTAGIGLIGAIGYLIYACSKGSQRKNLLINDLRAYIEDLETLASRRGQGPSPVQIQVQGPVEAEITLQFELPEPTPAPAEPVSTGLNSESVRRALSRNPQ